MDKTFTERNFDDLIWICQGIISIANNNYEGDITHMQMVMLGEKIIEFTKNPIVKNSGILKE